MSRRSQNRNQYETTTTEGLAIGAFSVTVVSVAGLDTNQDMYLVIEPDTVGQREWLKVVSITGNTLNIDNPNGRNLTGSDGDLKHDAGSVVRSVPTQQIFEDIFQDAEDDELNLTQHETDGSDPHAQAGYLKQSDADPLYVNVTGDTMNSLAQIKVDTDPSDVDDLSRKGYVDDSIAAQDHDHATPIGVHAAITDEHHARYTDAEADARAILQDHDHATPIATHTADADAHHEAFTQADADLLYLTLTGAELLYLKLDGSTPMTGALDMGLNDINDAKDAHFVNVNNSPSGFIEVLAGAGREVVAFGAGANAAVGGQLFLQIIGINDVSNTGFNFRAGGDSYGSITETVLIFPSVQENPIAGGSTVTVIASGQIARSSSALKYKEDVRDGDDLADLSLRPVSYRWKDTGAEYIGFIADELADADPRIGILNKENVVDNYDTRAVLAILAAKVNRLESA